MSSAVFYTADDIHAVEEGCSHAVTWRAVNMHREDELLPSLTMACVKTCIMRMKPVYRKIGKRQQGSNDITSNTCKARCGWGTHLGVRFNIYDYEEAHRNSDKRNEPIPAYYDKSKCSSLSIDQFSSWDETHRSLNLLPRKSFSHCSHN